MHGIAYLTAMGDELHFLGLVIHFFFNFSGVFTIIQLFMIETFSLKSSDLSTVP